MKSSEERRQERRQEERNYEADVYYDVWRSGGDPDRVDMERVDESHYQGLEHDEAASVELRHQNKA